MVSRLIIDNRTVRHRHVINRYFKRSLGIGGVVTFYEEEVKCAVFLLIGDVFIAV
jgi:hypothetical protein